MVYFQTKNHYLGKFWKVLQWKMLVFCIYFVYFAAKWYILIVICYILSPFGTFFPILVRCTDKNLATLLSTKPEDVGYYLSKTVTIHFRIYVVHTYVPTYLHTYDYKLHLCPRILTIKYLLWSCYFTNFVRANLNFRSYETEMLKIF
jgi:hypothetical protein